jgi:hypothetical protein
VNNVVSYQAAGIPGPVTISWDEYQARLASVTTTAATTTTG